MRTLSALLAVAGGVALLAAGAVPAFAVADGTPVPEGRYGFAAKLTMTDIPRPDGSHYNSGCSAALIAPQWIITAGHCFHDVNRKPVSGPVPYPVTATIGRTDDADTTGHVVDVIEDYQSPATDIAIAKLARPVRDVAPLRPATDAPAVGDVLRITGWGALSDVDPAPATHLQTGRVKVATVTDTVVGVVGYQPEPTTSACLYDSGAPYFAESRHHRPRLVAVESSGPACPHAQTETTSRVDPVRSWIYRTMAEHRH